MTNQREVTQRSERQLFVIGLIAALLPIWMAVWHLGTSGIIPNGDGAATVRRSLDVLSTNPPLVGMPAAGARLPGLIAHFPGAWQLYVLAPFVKIFGTSWGPPAAMAFLSSTWILLATWVLRRRLGSNIALAALALMALFSWSLGVRFLVDPIPINMVVFSLLPFCFLVWCTALGESRALVAMALLGNYLWLDHLVFVLVVPVFGLVGLAGYVLCHRSTLAASRKESWRARWLAWQGLIIAVFVTGVMLAPSFVYELKNSPGNIRLLMTSSGGQHQVVGSWSTSLHVIMSLIAYPRFWLAHSEFNLPFDRAPIGGTVFGSIDLFDMVATFIVLGSLSFLLWKSAQRNDRAAHGCS